MTKIELKPCPFCGGKAGFYHVGASRFFDSAENKDFDPGNDSWIVKCHTCEAESPYGGFIPPAEAGELWNTRKQEEIAVDKRRFAERLFFALLEKRENGSNDLRSIEALIDRSKRASDQFFGGK